MSFRLVPKSVTLNDLERRNGRYFALFQRICVPSGRTAYKFTFAISSPDEFLSPLVQQVNGGGVTSQLIILETNQLHALIYNQRTTGARRNLSREAQRLGGHFECESRAYNGDLKAEPAAGFKGRQKGSHGGKASLKLKALKHLRT